MATSLYLQILQLILLVQMSIICIGGICIPYSVLWPFIIILFKPLQNFFFPKKNNKHNIEINTSHLPPKNVPIFNPGIVINLSSEEEFTEIIKSHAVVRFTAQWCKPCHLLEPVFERLASKYASVKFVCVDVDKFENISAEMGAISLPYLVTFKASSKIGSLRSSKENEIEDLICDLQKQKQYHELRMCSSIKL